MAISNGSYVAFLNLQLSASLSFWLSGTRWFHELCVMLISLCFFTFMSLGTRASQSTMLFHKVSYYLRLSLSFSKYLIILVLFPFPYSGQSGKRSKFRELWNLFASLHSSQKYHMILTSLCLSISLSLVQSHLKASHYLRLHFDFCKSIVLSWALSLSLSLSKPCIVSGFSLPLQPGSLVQGQIPEWCEV